MEALAAERKALLFTAGGVPLALRLSQVREVVTAPTDAPAEAFRGAGPIEVASTLRLTPGSGTLAVLTHAPSLALYVDAVQGIIDLTQAEVFQLPASTRLPPPPPFQGALVHRGVVSLELAPESLARGAFHGLADHPGTPPQAPLAPGSELLFARGARTYGVPLQLLARVLDGPRFQAVPLAAPSHRGLLYHERALHPVFDVAVRFGDPPGRPAAIALLIDAGGEVVAVLADRVVPPAEGAAREVVRPSWDALFVTSPRSDGSAGKS
ncbi:MAG TPA: chemotaxis protein CheW [Anaeromyxobacteraceae bacterium]|nr:chemotaxis protein CheW [Anaeromyxobacteraceae bacterium]